MDFMSIFEVVRIKQEIKEFPEPFAQYAIRSPEVTG
jgi:DNA repair protein RadC